MARISLVPQNREFFRLLEAASENAVGIAQRLRDLMEGFPATADSLGGIKEMNPEINSLDVWLRIGTTSGARFHRSRLR